MPQMAPMNWTLLFSIFICAYLMSMILIYFTNQTSSMENVSPTSLTSPSNKLTWKW